jgi:hypothetical protein
VPVYEVTMRGVLLVADSPAALTGALASVLRARPAARGVGPYRELGEVTSGQCQSIFLEMVEPSRAPASVGLLAPLRSETQRIDRDSAPPSRTRACGLRVRVSGDEDSMTRRARAR